MKPSHFQFPVPKFPVHSATSPKKQKQSHSGTQKIASAVCNNGSQEDPLRSAGNQQKCGAHWCQEGISTPGFEVSLIWGDVRRWWSSEVWLVWRYVTVMRLELTLVGVVRFSYFVASALYGTDVACCVFRGADTADRPYPYRNWCFLVVPDSPHCYYFIVFEV